MSCLCVCPMYRYVSCSVNYVFVGFLSLSSGWKNKKVTWEVHIVQIAFKPFLCLFLHIIAFWPRCSYLATIYVWTQHMDNITCIFVDLPWEFLCNFNIFATRFNISFHKYLCSVLAFVHVIYFAHLFLALLKSLTARNRYNFSIITSRI